MQEALNADAGRLCELLEQLRSAERSDVSVVLPPLHMQSQLDFSSLLAPATPSTERAAQTATLLRQCLVDGTLVIRPITVFPTSFIMQTNVCFDILIADAIGVPEEFKYSMRAIHITSLDIKYSRADGVKVSRNALFLFAC